MRENHTTPNRGQLCHRIEMADYKATFPWLWGGTRISLDSHALRRGKERLYEGMSFDLLASNIAEVMNNEELGIQVLFEIPMGSKFVVLDEKSGCTIFAAIGEYDAENDVNECYIYSVFEHDPAVWAQSTIFVEAENNGLYKIRQDGSLECNPAEMRVNDRREKESG